APGDAPGDALLFEADALRHPLLAAGVAVANPLALAPGEVVLVTGSNMSGKSTFLRAAGLAVVLAWAGSAVPARALRLRPLRVFTSMRVGDAVQEGLSTFYAEVRRLRALLDAAATEAPPALVLIDEMLRGTNNRERLAGGQAIARALAGGPGAALVATHDLALADLAEGDPRFRNAHFREEAEGDTLVFDYRLREGPCPTTNALVIMRRAGLPVA
ncbi:MAG: MutS-related protein, partial [Rubricoccaceae bacterium]